jgi:hypothetical protein
MPRYTKALKLCLFPLVLSAVITLPAQLPVPAQTGESGLIAGGSRPDLILAYTGDVIGYIDPCG